MYPSHVSSENVIRAQRGPAKFRSFYEGEASGSRAKVRINADAEPRAEEPGAPAVEVAVAGQGSAQCTDAAGKQADSHYAAGALPPNCQAESCAECGIAARPRLKPPTPSSSSIQTQPSAGR